MDALFETCAIGNMKLRNRFLRSATWEGMATGEGEVTDGLVDLYRALGSGGVGLVIVSCSNVDPRGKGMPGLISIDRDALVPGLARIASAVREEGGKSIIQIYHSGAQKSVKNDLPTEAPSAVPDRASGVVPLEMAPDDIARVVKAFAEAARRAKEAGFDGIQLHCAHGYLLSQFLSPYTNTRTDHYGGSIENRARMIFQVYDAVREEVGPDYPVLIKINVEDFDGVGLTADDSLWVCEQLDARGIDAIELSGGDAVRTKIYKPEKEAYFKDHAKRVSARVTCPVILVGGLRSLEVIDALYDDGAATFFSLSRPLISEPGLINRWRSGDTKKARCASCNKCFRPAFKEKKLYCAGFAKVDGLHAEETT